MTSFGSFSSDGAVSSVAVSVERLADAVVVTVTGEVDLLTAPEVERAVLGVLDEGPAVLIIDLLGVSFLASAGLAVLVDAHNRAADRTRLRIVAAGPSTLRPLQVTGLVEPLAVYANRDDALSAARPTQAS